MTAPLRFSASRINTWMTCPLQAKYQYVDGLPRSQSAAATFGSSVHKALEHYCQTHNVAASIDIFEDHWTNPGTYGIEPDTWPRNTTFGGYMKKGIDTIRAYHDQQRWLTTDFIASEHKFLVPFGEFELTGFVDLLEFTRDKQGRDVVEITDFKTNSRAPYMSALPLNIQFTIYDYASQQPEFWLGNGDDFPPIAPPRITAEEAWERAQLCARKNTWYGLVQGKPYDAGERQEADIFRLYRVAKEIAKALEHDVYVPNISGDSCGLCPYALDPCPLPFDPRPTQP